MSVQNSGALAGGDTSSMDAAYPATVDLLSSNDQAAAAAAPVSPTMAQEVSYISGITNGGVVTSPTFSTWAGDNPDADKGGTASSSTVYNTTSNAFKWGPSQTPGTSGGTINYYFTPASNWTTIEQSAFASSMAIWSAVANVSFNAVTTAGTANLTITRASDGNAYFENKTGQTTTVGSTTLGGITTGLISLDTSKPGFGPLTTPSANDAYPGSTLVHEISHVLGLGHGGAYNGTVVPSTAQYSAFDTRQWAISSYIAPTDSTGKYAASYTVNGTNWGNVQAPETFMPLDILAVQQLYGAATTGPLTGGQVFGYSTNITGALANYYDFSQNSTPVLTIWDAGANNTLNLSGYSTGSTINLNPGTFSSANGMVNNIGIAFNTAINTAVGGTGDDTITVNAAADTIDGGAGTNTVVFSGTQASYSFSRAGNVLSVTNTSNSVVDTLTNVATLTFSDGSVAAASVACYAAGTLIATASGEAAVETLRIGDMLVTASGAHRPLRWVGRRSYDGRFIARNPAVLPILIRAGALEDGVPKRDLFVSPEHAMGLDDALIPAKLLVNGTTILQAKAVDRVDYFHLELDSHDMLIAEGAPSESFVDDGSRGMFRNAAEFAVLYPDATPAPAQYCAPRIEDGEQLETVRQRLDARFHARAPAPRIEGRLDAVQRDCISGWARDLASPGARLQIDILDNGVVIGAVLADQYRADLVQSGIGDGAHAFDFAPAGGLSPLVRHVIEVRSAQGGAILSNAPWVLEAVPLTLATQAARPTANGAIDIASRERIAGWAWNPASPTIPVALQILDNGMPIARVLANSHRGDLVTAGIGDGAHSFDITIPGGLSPLARHVIEVRRESDGAPIAGSPQVIEPAGLFDGAMEQAIARAVAAVAESGEQERVLSFVLAQAETLRRQRGDQDAGRTARRDRAQSARRSGKAPAAAAPRALVIDARVPVLGRDAGSHAVLSHMQALQQLGHDVSFVAADEMGANGAAVEHLRAAGIAVCTAPVYSAVEDVLQRQDSCFDVIYLHRAKIASRYMALARGHAPGARILYSVADLHHLRLQRQAEVEDRPELMDASESLRVQETMAAWAADAVITHSGVEAAVLRQAIPGVQVHQVGWHVPTIATPTPFAARHGVAFIGHYGHAPNRDAALRLVHDIMPLVWQADPSITCLLVGSDMDHGIRALAGPRVVAVGQVDDLGSVLGAVRLTVAPVRFGAGIKGKVLDSLAAGVPCVMSPVAAEGLDLPAALQAWVGQDDAALARTIVALHGREHRRERAAARAMIRTGHSQAAVVMALGEALVGQRRRAVA